MYIKENLSKKNMGGDRLFCTKWKSHPPASNSLIHYMDGSGDEDEEGAADVLQIGHQFFRLSH